MWLDGGHQSILCLHAPQPLSFQMMIVFPHFFPSLFFVPFGNRLYCNAFMNYSHKFSRYFSFFSGEKLRIMLLYDIYSYDKLLYAFTRLWRFMWKKQCKFQRIYCLRGEKNTNQLIVKMPKFWNRIVTIIMEPTKQTTGTLKIFFFNNGLFLPSWHISKMLVVCMCCFFLLSLSF